MNLSQVKLLLQVCSGGTTEGKMAISETLATGLEEYRIGPKIRALRHSKRLSLMQLGEHSGLSPGLLSKLERGQLVPTLPTLLRIALVFGVGLEHFFEPEKRPVVAVVRRHDRLRLPDQPGRDIPSYFFESLDFPVTDRRMEAYLAEFPADAPESSPHEHDGAEFAYVFSGRLVIRIGDEVLALQTGDAIYFDPSVAHSYRSEGTDGCTAIFVVSP
jgi:transcriptional regulator with XRE-family HTH domain